ncbi:heme-degrading domain-containing protein [Psychromonas antarctica]|uniref:heme-degrading domain-containing protein n=1 Tax=Psychromonas antarctica TaxID=67573 RepID=UPI001EE82F90|nr:heme-degrading domain-containing protein [Psychromonas antarctica]MCG6201376.1 heme-degrading domain-containing protein [Psychromonas antarctica]
MSTPYLLADLLAQESELQFDLFNNHTAWQLGCKLKKTAEDKNAVVAIEVYAFNQILFSYAMPGTQVDNSHWIKRKRDTVLRFGHSTYYIGQYNKAKNREFEQQMHINAYEYCAHGGAFPIRIKNCGLVGVVTVSGLPQEEDHQMVINALTDLI